MAKVKVSGGGRCNVTNTTPNISNFVKGYPRGAHQVKKLLKEFSNMDMVHWLRERGVKTYAQPDGRMFPVSNNSQTIIDCFLEEAKVLGLYVHHKSSVQAITAVANQWKLLMQGSSKALLFDKIIVATGGGQQLSFFNKLEKMGHKIEPPIPSLFTFNLPENPINHLAGVSVAEVETTIQGSHLKATGPLLVTHQGVSGPAILKLSAFGARWLHTHNYEFTLRINWLPSLTQNEMQNLLSNIKHAYPKKQFRNAKPLDLPDRLWLLLLKKSDMLPSKIWAEISKKEQNKLVNTLANDTYLVKGKSTFKEEFVTCGGVSWQSIDAKTLQSKACSGIYFAGEVLDIDGITGGYNFQAAWTTGYVAGKLS